MLNSNIQLAFDIFRCFITFIFNFFFAMYVTKYKAGFENLKNYIRINFTWLIRKDRLW